MHLPMAELVNTAASHPHHQMTSKARFGYFVKVCPRIFKSICHNITRRLIIAQHLRCHAQKFGIMSMIETFE